MPACIPGYPQDMFMAMDELVAKPETYGLRPGWSGGTMGMMTIVRVVTPELFEKIRAAQGRAGGERECAMTAVVPAVVVVLLAAAPALGAGIAGRGADHAGGARTARTPEQPHDERRHGGG